MVQFVGVRNSSNCGSWHQRQCRFELKLLTGNVVDDNVAHLIVCEQSLSTFIYRDVCEVERISDVKLKKEITRRSILTKPTCEVIVAKTGCATADIDVTVGVRVDASGNTSPKGKIKKSIGGVSPD